MIEHQAIQEPFILPNNNKLPEGINYTFETERLIIRPLEEQDREFYISLYTDKKIMRHICEPFSLEAANKAFSATLRAMHVSVTTLFPKTMTWCIVNKENNALLGIQSIDFRETEIIKKDAIGFTTKDEVEFGIILSRQAQGKQLPQEAIIGLAQFTFGVLKIKRVYCTFNKHNKAVTNFIKKVGFQSSSSIRLVDETKEYQYLLEASLSNK